MNDTQDILIIASQ